MSPVVVSFSLAIQLRNRFASGGTEANRTAEAGEVEVYGPTEVPARRTKTLA
jgi:hypothetical protein